jgi:RNA polymerase sigma factor (sigma-70 family)
MTRADPLLQRAGLYFSLAAAPVPTYTNDRQSIDRLTGWRRGRLMGTATQQRIREEIGRARTRELLVRTARRVVQGQDPEDVAHDAIVQALSHAEQFREDAQANTWLYRITFNTALMKRRSVRRTERNKSRARTELSAFAADQRSAAGWLEAAEAQQELRAAVARLPAPYREVIERCVYDEQAADRVGAALGITSSAVRTRFTRARARLREMLETA